MKEITGTYVNKIGSAIKATNSATCARMALSAGADRASMAGTSWTRKAALSSETSGSTSIALISGCQTHPLKTSKMTCQIPAFVKIISNGRPNLLYAILVGLLLKQRADGSKSVKVVADVLSRNHRLTSLILLLYLYH